MVNNLDDCDILEKAINFTNVREHNDVLVAIKLQTLKSRYAKYIWCNCSRVVRECHGNRTNHRIVTSSGAKGRRNTGRNGLTQHKT